MEMIFTVTIAVNNGSDSKNKAVVLSSNSGGIDADVMHYGDDEVARWCNLNDEDAGVYEVSGTIDDDGEYIVEHKELLYSV